MTENALFCSWCDNCTIPTGIVVGKMSWRNQHTLTHNERAFTFHKLLTEYAAIRYAAFARFLLSNDV